MSVEIKLDGLGDQLKEAFADIVNPQSNLFREVALSVIPLLQERIHVQGRAADGSQIGTYSNSYLKVRTGDYGNADRYSRGKNKGKNKNAGTVSGGDRAGASRPKYNRSGDTKVILSLTRQLENDYTVIGLPNGWGIGFTNQHNYDKANWNDERYGKKIFDLSTGEKDMAVQITQDLISRQY